MISTVVGTRGEFLASSVDGAWSLYCATSSTCCAARFHDLSSNR
jgi:hypothetical protein